MKIKTRKGKKYFEIPIDYKWDKWCDNDHVLFLTTMAIFGDYVEGELGGLKALDETIKNYIEGLDDPDSEYFVEFDKVWLEHYIEVRKIYKFWKAWSAFVERIEDEYLYSESNLWYHWEEKLSQLEDQMMLRVINIRGGMWT